jgi:hypothetical protein
MQRCGLMVSVLAFVASPVAASEFFVAQNTASKQCRVVEEKPDGTKWEMVGTASYPTLAEARTARRANSECVKGPTDKD